MDYPDYSITLYDIGGSPIASLTESAFDETLTRVLNGIDSFSWSMHLDAPETAQVLPIQRLVRVWRGGALVFAGVVGPRSRNAASRTANFTAYSPLWRLQHRFHIDPHDFTYITGRGQLNPALPTDAYAGGTDPSEIMWTMIEFTSQVVLYTGGDDAGITEGSFATYSLIDNFETGPPLLGKRYSRGQNTWDLIQEILQAPGMPDLDCTYIDGGASMMQFNTVAKKGADNGFSLDYRTGQKNLDDLIETTSVEPGSFANYVAVQGQGDTDAQQTIVRADGVTQPIPRSGGLSWTPPDLITSHGLYMRFEQIEEALEKDGLNARAYGQYLLRRNMYPPVNYEPVLSPAVVWNWPGDFDVGDTVTINCNRDSMAFSAQRRIDEVTVKRGPDGSETFNLSLHEDLT
jgi:hypothetical protein